MTGTPAAGDASVTGGVPSHFIAADLRFSVNLSLVFRDIPIPVAAERARKLGFDAVELWWPFAAPVPDDRDIDHMLTALANAGTRLVALNLYAGEMEGEDRGLVSLPARLGELQANVPVVLEIVNRTGCRVLNALYGNLDGALEAAYQRAHGVQVLSELALAAQPYGAEVVIEALNPWEFPNYGLHTTRAALDVVGGVAATGTARIRLLHDLYHRQRSEGNLIATLREHATSIGHVQLADSPGRHEPGTGEIAFDRVLGALAATGYRGYVGLEYIPREEPERGLQWLRDLGWKPVADS